MKFYMFFDLVVDFMPMWENYLYEVCAFALFCTIPIMIRKLVLG